MKSRLILINKTACFSCLLSSQNNHIFAPGHTSPPPKPTDFTFFRHFRDPQGEVGSGIAGVFPSVTTDEI
ncbi:hypothetical protein [Ferrimonas futtsuensis]|uniref:hypothetical protein n=1 Tax=Ferrimonas futtsuensis TaxID=364764 RepID=UPI0012FA2438|nr:hypothetical protein [Ferrimonas futtsuensis]